MKLNIDGVEYRVRFKHEHFEPTAIPGTDIVIKGRTIAEMLDGVLDVEIAVSAAYCSGADQYNKKKGRKIAFTKLLKDCYLPWTRDKKKRGAAWEQFKKQVKIL